MIKLSSGVRLCVRNSYREILPSGTFFQEKNNPRQTTSHNLQNGQFCCRTRDIRVADAGEVGEELEAWGGTLTGRNGRNSTVTADKKIMANLGVTQQSSTALIASRMAAVAQ